MIMAESKTKNTEKEEVNGRIKQRKMQMYSLTEL